MTARRLRVLVVDDSAVVRQTVRRALDPQPGWSVDVAGDPVVALRRIREDPPDVILLDLEMPRMDGLTFLRHLMAVESIPVVVLSGHAPSGSEVARAVLEAGAVKVLAKPELSLKDFLQGEASSLAEILQRAAESRDGVRTERRSDGAPSPSTLLRVDEEAEASGSAGASGDEDSRTGEPPRPTVVESFTAREPREDDLDLRFGDAHSDPVILIGASMGGPGAVREVLSVIPVDGPPCVVVQHMMPRFTGAFIRRLDEAVSVRVREAESGDVLRRGRVLVAPGGRQTRLVGGGREVTIIVDDGPPVHGHRPSVDVLFHSAAEVLGARVVAALLTGIGRDGAEGLLDLRQAGAATVVQDEVTSTAFGMPRAAIELEAAELALPLGLIGSSLLQLAGEPLTPPDSGRAGEGPAAAPEEPDEDAEVVEAG